ncbi:MAG: hypothetical protein ABR497_07985 [Kiritimatiellia bacterium]|nr:hypothetical protein [Lentisphaerota bacterium]
MIYESKELKLLPDRVIDRLGEITLADIPDPQPQCPVRLAGATPLMERLWRVALHDAETNIRDSDQGRYFAGGAKFGTIVFTRDISYAGVLGFNGLYPEIMRSGLKITREVRWKAGFVVTTGHVVSGIDAPWEDPGLDNQGFKELYNTNCYTRRTDDVVWLWAARDLFAKTSPGQAEWTWLYENGKRYFERFYRPFYDADDGLYRGQISFVDVRWPHKPRAGGYPAHFTVDDCVMLKASSTNALYLNGLRVMAEAAEQLGLQDQAVEWQRRAQALRNSIQAHLVRPDGRIACYKDRHGRLSGHVDALGTALCVLHDAVDAETAARSVKHYPRTDIGIPLFDPFFPHDSMYHNNASWPFVDALFLAAADKVGESQAAFNLALLARVVKADGFHELVDMRNGAVVGSGHQLWSAAAFVSACRRAGLQMTTNSVI